MEQFVPNDSANEMIPGDMIHLEQIKIDQQALQSNFIPLQSLEPLQRYADYRAKTTVGFQRANWEKGIQNKNLRWNRYHKGEEVPYTVDLQHFKAYGPGIYLFFVFLKQVTFVFFIISLISMIPIIYNLAVGTNLANVGDSIQAYIAWTTIGNQQAIDSNYTDQQYQQSLKNKLFNVIPEIVYSLVFVGFYFFWSWKSQKLVKEVQKQIKLTSHKTIELVQFPQEATEQQVYQFMSKFGRVEQVAPVKNYQDMIFYSKKIYQMSLELKEIRITQGQQSDQSQKVKKKIQQMDELSKKLKEQEQSGQFKIIKYYVVYSQPSQRQTAFQAFRPYNQSCFSCKKLCCNVTIPQDLYLNGVLCNVERCHVQPGQILWQNAHVTWRTRWIRFLIQFLFVAVMIVLGFLLISLLNISNPPLQNSNVDTSSYNSVSIQAQKNTSIIESWCLKNKDDGDNLPEVCDTFVLQYYYKVAITIGISLIIIIVQSIIKIIVIALAKFQRYTSVTQQSKDMITNLFCTYICTTVLITVLLQANIFGISFKNFAKHFISDISVYKENLDAIVEYSDFVGYWYIDIGYQIWLNLLILAFSPHCFWPLIQLIKEKIGYCMGKRQVLQKNLEKWIEAEEFQIEDHYANIMMLVFVGLVFAPGIPLLIPISFFGLLTRFISLKYSFIRYSRIPKTYDESLNSRMIQVMAAAIIFHYAFSIWMFGVSQIFAQQYNWLSDLISNSSVSTLVMDLLVFLQKISTSWYLTILFGIVLLTIIFKSFLFDLIIRFCTKKQVPSAIINNNSSKIQIASQISLTKSYKLQNNPDYFQILAIMNPKLVQSNI